DKRSFAARLEQAVAEKEQELAELAEQAKRIEDAKHAHEKSLLNQELEILQKSLSELSSSIDTQKSQYELLLKSHEAARQEDKHSFAARLEQAVAEKEQELAEQAERIEEERLSFDEHITHVTAKKDKAIAKQERTIKEMAVDFDALNEKKEALESKIEELKGQIYDLDQQLTREKKERQADRDTDLEARSQLSNKISGEVELAKARLLELVHQRIPAKQEVSESEDSDVEDEEELTAELNDELENEEKVQAPITVAASHPATVKPSEQNQSLLARLNKHPLLKNGLPLAFSAGVGALFFYAGGVEAATGLLADYVLPSTGLDVALTSLMTGIAFAGTKGVEYGISLVKPVKPVKSAASLPEIIVTEAPKDIAKSTAQNQQKAASTLHILLETDAQDEAEASSDYSSSRSSRSKQKWATPLRDAIGTRSTTRAARQAQADNDSRIADTTALKGTSNRR
ncbi:MAG TPA: hypothetical protein PLD88_06395, partial [Candidatus Berkiella sp.]|nr:hypothetical protein [Candidatus Berkiella sp.]